MTLWIWKWMIVMEMKKLWRVGVSVSNDFFVNNKQMKRINVNKQNNNNNLMNKNNFFVNNMNRWLLLRKKNKFINVNEIMLWSSMESL